jgi:hypothetical protein
MLHMWLNGWTNKPNQTLPKMAISSTAAIIITQCSHTQVNNDAEDDGIHVNVNHLHS